MSQLTNLTRYLTLIFLSILLVVFCFSLLGVIFGPLGVIKLLCSSLNAKERTFYNLVMCVHILVSEPFCRTVDME